MLVACICITADRPEFTTKAVSSFLAQDYPDKRLLVYDTSEKKPESLARGEEIEHVWIARDNGDTVGSLRNKANSVAVALWTPNALAHWDSDDVSAPGRLSDQVKRLRETGKLCTGYNRIVFTNGQRRWLYMGDPQYALGTSLMYRTAWWLGNKFAEVNKGEDNQMVSILWNMRQLAVADGSQMIEAWMHAGNVSPKVPAQNWKPL